MSSAQAVVDDCVAALVKAFAIEDIWLLEANAAKKLREKNCDIIVANDARIAMETDENELLILFRDGETKKISRSSKTNLARELVKIFQNSQQKV